MTLERDLALDNDTSRQPHGQTRRSTLNRHHQKQEHDDTNITSSVDDPQDTTAVPPATPTKKRKFDELRSRSRSRSSRAISPPWKPFAADRPTQFTDNGKRRSGRVNHVSNTLTTNGTDTHDAPHQKPVRTSSRSSTLASSLHLAKKKELVHFVPDQPAVAKPKSARKSEPPHNKKSLKSAAHHDLDAKSEKGSSQLAERRKSDRPHRAAATLSGTPVQQDGRSRLTRHNHVSPIKTPHEKKHILRLPKPPIHPRHPSHIPKPSPFAALSDILDHYEAKEKEQAKVDALDALIERKLETPVQNPEQQAQDEAAARSRLLEASRPGGLLSKERCSVYLPERQAEPPMQYGHSDHMLAHLLYLRTLMAREHVKHVDNAKKLAHACMARWKEKQPQTQEERVQEEDRFNRLIYRQIVVDIQRKWELVLAETQRRRLSQWIEDQELTRDRKMQRLLEDTTKMLDRRRLTVDGDLPVSESDDEREAGSDASSVHDDTSPSSQGSSRSEDDDVMSSSDSSEGDGQDGNEEDADDKLSPEALRAKYAVIALDQADNDHRESRQDSESEHTAEVMNIDPSEDELSQHDVNVTTVALDEVDEALLDDEDDESTDMSDDMGSSDQESQLEQDESESESDAGQKSSLLGFLDNSERRRLEKPLQDIPEHLEHTPAEFDVDKETSMVDDLPAPKIRFPSVASQEADHSSPTSPPDGNTTNEPTEVDSATTLEIDEPPVAATPTDSTHVGRNITTKIPALLRATLREYQHYGLDWLAKLYVNQTNGILADEMGLGKTIQTIALLAHLAEEHHVWGPHLIVVPTSVILNWEMEFKKFLPGFRILSYYGSQEERAAKRKGWSNPDKYNVVITSYQLVLKDLSSIRVPEWHYMILDEAHNIKNFQSQRYQAMIRLKTHARLLLTGTPLQNSIQELWSLLTFLTAGQDGQGMGDLEEFTQWFKRPVDEIFVDGKNKLGVEAQEIVNKLHHSLRPYILRRMKSQVEKQLPGKYEHTVFCRLSKRQRQLYDAFLGRADVKEKLNSGNPISVSQALMALRKVCNHPDLFEERPIVTSFTMRKPFSTMPRSAVADFEIKELLVRRHLITKDARDRLSVLEQDLNLIGLESRSKHLCYRVQRLRASHLMGRLFAGRHAQIGIDSPAFAGHSLGSISKYSSIVNALDHQDRLARHARLTERRAFYMPVYGAQLVERCTIYKSSRLRLPSPSSLHMRHSTGISFDELRYLPETIKSVDERAAAMQTLVQKFAFVTPNVVAHDLLPYMMTKDAIDTLRATFSASSEPDSFHESRVRLSIAFPDSRLLQYDCGKLQRLALLLRQIQSRGSRALIFTQMTSVLNILELFLNLHGYRYLRLDGSTRIEHRQEMMERFNRDTRLDVFILSSRSGGVGMNLTGADTVIFYDLDWNPQMDKQCQDRAHRIGQTRDVHIYKLVSEHTIEMNILKKSNQKRMLDEVVIQEGEFTTDVFNRVGASSEFEQQQQLQKTGQEADYEVEDDDAGAAADRVLGLDSAPRQGPGSSSREMAKVLAAAEEAVDVEAAVARAKEAYVDEIDFGVLDAPKPRPTALSSVNVAVSSSPTTTSLAPSPITSNAPGTPVAEEGEEDPPPPHVDEYMLRFAAHTLRDQPFVPPVDKKGRLDKNGRDRSHRPRKR